VHVARSGTVAAEDDLDFALDLVELVAAHAHTATASSISISISNAAQRNGWQGDAQAPVSLETWRQRHVKGCEDHRARIDRRPDARVLKTWGKIELQPIFSI
jgi:uncharacterized protein YhfF